MIKKVPFYLQKNKMTCGITAIKMVLEYYGKKYSEEELEETIKLSEEQKNKVGIATLQLALITTKLGFKTKLYTKNDELPFKKIEKDYEKKILEAYKTLKEKKVIIKKTLTLKEILEYLKKDIIPIVLIDWNTIIQKKGYQGHFVTITGYDEENIIIHNQDSKEGKNIKIKKTLFEKARKHKETDEDILIISKD